MRCCRTCLGEGKEMKYIHSVISITGVDVRLSDILLNFYNYKVTDRMLPEYICINCVYQLTITYSFKVLVESSLKKLMNKHSYSESASDNNDDYLVKEEKKYSEQDIKLKSESKLSNFDIEPSTELFCVECKAEFKSTKPLFDHCMKNHPVKNNIGRACEYCNEKFDDFRTLIMHRKLHLRPFMCDYCWVGFYSQDDLKQHHCQPNPNKSKENTDKKLLRQCDQCGKSYPPGYIRIHMLTHGNNKAYSCKYCPKKFKVPGSLNSHILWNHKRTRNHRCEVCNATFITSSSRSSHIRKNHLKETKYACETCGKRFFSKSELQRHSLTHTGVKNFHCHLCDKSYQTRYGLNVHLKSHPQPVLLNL